MAKRSKAAVEQDEAPNTATQYEVLALCLVAEETFGAPTAVELAMWGQELTGELRGVSNILRDLKVLQARGHVERQGMKYRLTKAGWDSLYKHWLFDVPKNPERHMRDLSIRLLAVDPLRAVADKEANKADVRRILSRWQQVLLAEIASAPRFEELVTFSFSPRSGGKPHHVPTLLESVLVAQKEMLAKYIADLAGYFELGGGGAPLAQRDPSFAWMKAIELVDGASPPRRVRWHK